MKYSKKISLLLLSFALLFLVSCSGFQVRHIDETGKTRTYVTDTIYTGTGTLVDCVISPFHWVMGLFYMQPYIRSNSFDYPTFGGSGCFNYGYGHGIWGLFGLGPGFLNPDGGPARVQFVDANGREVEIIGGAIEVVRVSKKINFGFN